ncbi:MAG: ABC transporter permease [Acetivibrionales bacterium]|jgi:inositol transport system permease protein
METANARLSEKSGKITDLLNRYSTLAILLLMIVIITICEPLFISPMNILNVIRQISIIAIAGFGVTMIIITTGIDLSLGSIIAIASVTSASFAHPGEYPLIVTILVGLAGGVLAGLVNGLLVAYAKLPAFIATLGMMISARGVAYIITKGHPVTGFSKEFDFIGRGYLLGIPFIIYVLLFCGIVSYVILRHTKLGRCIYAVGGNEQAAIVSGINVKKTLMFVYTYSGLMSAVSGILLASRLSSGQPTAGTGYELDAIAGAVIGGTSLSGGIGTIQGTFIGALIIGVLNNGMDLLHVSAYWQMLARGAIIVGAVLLDRLRNK